MATRPMPVLAFHGTQDPILKFNGGVGDALTKIFSHRPAGPTTTSTTVPVQLNGTGYPAAAAAWAQRDGCAPTPVDERVTTEVIHRRFRCPPGVAVEMFIVVGGGHAWPGSKLSAAIHNVVGYTTFDIDATAEIWKFFQRFSR